MERYHSISGPITAASYIIAMFTRSVLGLYVMRILQGFAMSAIHLISPIYLGEIAEVHIRGTIGTLFQISVHLGILYTYWLGAALSYEHYLISSLVVPLLFIATFIFMPESPYYHVLQNEDQKAIESLKWLRNKTEGEIQSELREIKKNTVDNIWGSNTDVKKTNYKEFFGRSNLKALGFILLLITFRTFSGVQTTIAYANTIFGASASFLPPDYISVLFGILLLVSIFPSTYLVDRAGRKFLLLVSTAGCAVFSLVAAVYYYLTAELHHDIPYTSWVPFASISLVGVFFNLGFGPILTPLVSEYFTPSTKAASSAAMNLWATTVGLISYKLFYIFNLNIGMYSNFVFGGICSLVCTFYIYYSMFETKGMSFNEIQNMFKYGHKDRANNRKPDGVKNQTPEEGVMLSVMS